MYYLGKIKAICFLFQMVSYCVRRFFHLGLTSERAALKSPLIIKKATKLEDKDDISDFVDWIRVRVRGGDGGDGGISMLR